jgi:hypothetical protein
MWVVAAIAEHVLALPEAAEFQLSPVIAQRSYQNLHAFGI